MAAEDAFDPVGAVPAGGAPTGDFDPTGAKPVEAAVPPPASAAAAKIAAPSKPVAQPEELPFMDRVHLDMAEGAEERELYLKNRYGKNAVKWEFVPSGGKRPGEVAPAGEWRLVITTGGKQYTDKTGLGSSLVADAPTMTGAAGGAMVGAQIGALGGPFDPFTIPAGALIGAGVGGMMGKGASEVEKKVEGNSSAAPLEMANRSAKSGLEMMAGEGTGRIVGKLGSRLTRGPLPSVLTDATPETRAMTERTLAGGARPPAQSTMPGARKLQRIEILANKLSGVKSGQAEANKGYLQRRLKSILTRSGIPAEHTDAVMKELDDPTSAISTKKIGQDVQDAVRAHVSMLEAGVDKSLAEAQKATDASIKHLNALSDRYKPGDLGLDVAAGISQARSQFATAATKIFKQVDRITGGRALVPTGQMVREAQSLVALIPESDASRAVVKKIADYPEFVTFEQAQRARTQLNELRFSSNLTPGATKHEYGRLAEAIDRAFGMAKKLTAKDFTPPARATSTDDDALLKDFGIAPRSEAPANAEEYVESAKSAAKMLETADKFYSDGIKKFNDTTVNRLVASARAGLPPDPNIVARTIFQPGQEARVREIRKLIGEDTFKRAAAVHWQENILAPVTGQDGTVSGQRLYQKLTQQGDLLDTVYGKEGADRMRNLAQLLSGMDGYLPAAKMQPGFAQILTGKIEQAKGELDVFMKENFLSTLANPKQTPEDALRWITQPGQGARLEQAAKFFGEQSEQMQGVRGAALRQLVDGTITNAVKGEGSKALIDTLSQYTERQQKLLFPNGLDEDLRLFGKEIEFLFPSEGDPAMAGFAAGSVLEKGFIRRNWIIGKSTLLRSIITQPGVIRALAIGLRGTSKTREATRHAIQQMAYFGALELSDDDDGGPNEQSGPPGTTPVGTGAAAGVAGSNNPAAGGVAIPR